MVEASPVLVTARTTVITCPCRVPVGIAEAEAARAAGVCSRQEVPAFAVRAAPEQLSLPVAVAEKLTVPTPLTLYVQVKLRAVCPSMVWGPAGEGPIGGPRRLPPGPARMVPRTPVTGASPGLLTVSTAFIHWPTDAAGGLVDMEATKEPLDP